MGGMIRGMIQAMIPGMFRRYHLPDASKKVSKPWVPRTADNSWQQLTNNVSKNTYVWQVWFGGMIQAMIPGMFRRYHLPDASKKVSKPWVPRTADNSWQQLTNNVSENTYVWEVWFGGMIQAMILGMFRRYHLPDASKKVSKPWVPRTADNSWQIMFPKIPMYGRYDSEVWFKLWFWVCFGGIICLMLQKRFQNHGYLEQLTTVDK